MRALEDHRRLLREAFAAHGGVEVEMQGDSFHFAFPDPCEAVHAAARAQRALAEHAWQREPIRVRIGIHTGEPLVAGHLYAGLDVHRAARVMSAGHGGQVLLSERTQLARSGPLARRALPPRPRRAPAQGPVGAAAALPARRGGVPAARVALPDEPAGTGDPFPRPRARVAGGDGAPRRRTHPAPDPDGSRRVGQDPPCRPGRGRRRRVLPGRRLLGRARRPPRARARRWRRSRRFLAPSRSSPSTSAPSGCCFCSTTSSTSWQLRPSSPRFLPACPNLALLVTSREALHLTW